MSIQEVAITKAIALLIASGAKFKVILGDKDWGELEVAQEPKRRRSRHVNNFRGTGYRTQVPEMKPGDSLKYSFESREMAMKFQKSLSGHASYCFGPNNFLTSVTDNVAEVLRVA